MSLAPCLFLGIVLLLSGCAERDDPADPTILSLRGQKVRRSDFERYVAAAARRSEDSDPSLRQALLVPFLEERVLVLEARAQGLVAAGSTPEEEKAAVEALLGKAVPAAEPSDEEVGAYYSAHPEEFRRSETVTLSQILVPTQNEARDIRRRLQRDPKSFEIMARTRSRSPEASTGGLMGTFERGQLPADLEGAAFSLPAGGTSEIVHSPLGYHVLRVDGRTGAREESLAESGPRIRAQLRREKMERSVTAFVRRLLSDAKVNHEIALRVDRVS
jgi:parvulin-like peptidyl-prolyl isomerase